MCKLYNEDLINRETGGTNHRDLGLQGDANMVLLPHLAKP